MPCLGIFHRNLYVWNGVFVGLYPQDTSELLRPVGATLLLLLPSYSVGFRIRWLEELQRLVEACPSLRRNDLAHGQESEV